MTEDKTVNPGTRRATWDIRTDGTQTSKICDLLGPNYYSQQQRELKIVGCL